jgi:ABC-type phosphate transport system substrate-binding protein
MRHSWYAKGVVLAGFIATAGAFFTPPKPDFEILVHASNPIGELPRAKVAQIFLKKLTRWPNGRPVLVVDQLEDATVRHRFTTAILQKEMRQVDSYWQEMIFSGRAVPPPQRRSDAAVIAYIRENPGAIGYVSAAAASAADDLTIIDVRP